MSKWRPGLLVAVKDAGQALFFIGAVQPDVGAATADLISGFGEKLAHGGGQVAHVGQRGGGGNELGQLSEAGGFLGGVWG